ncbi:porin [Rhodobacter sp. CZR27]|uniref:porin n=1 Tax=Rhodobacter sp. CZR27 TaxID=2033869 RepID=UPI000BBE4051|nr:porin [Rhodobacter sp. CZR27]
MRLKCALITLPLMAVLTLPAHAADLTFSNAAGTTVTFYGQVNLTYQGVDDGRDTYDSFVDNSNSTSRVGFWIDGKLFDNRFRFNLETGLGIKNTAETSQTEDANWIDWQRTDIRKLEVVSSGNFGAIWLGQGSMATDGAAEVDNSGTSLAGYSNLADTAGGFFFRDGEALSDVTIGGVFRNLDGSRRFRLRYDTPEFSGFTISAAAGTDVLSEDDDATYYDAALRYGHENDTFALDAAMGYSWKDDDGEMTEQALASASATHLPSGLNLTLAMGEQMSDEGQYLYAKLGWRGDLVPVGETAIAADIYDGSDFGTVGSESGSWGVTAVQQFADIGLEAFLGYRVYDHDDVPGADYEDISTVLVGARWKF